MKRTIEPRMESLRSALLAAAIWLLSGFVSGCALTTDHVTLTYSPQTGINKISGADSVRVTVEVLDLRSVREKVSSKKNGYGMEMAPIVATEEVSLTLAKAIEVELSNRGFVPAPGSIRLVAELQKFYNDFKVGFWSGTAAAELIMNVQIKKPDGGFIFSKLVAGEANIPGIMLASGENAKTALQEALKEALSKLFRDQAFVEALFEAAKLSRGVG
jgi:uncharacterized lipoprotein